MAEKILKSPGVSAREIDLSAPGQVRVQGVPAAVIGTAQRGPAFVPVTFATYADFKAQFGGSDGEKFGPIAVAEWMKNARAGAYVRVLGIGDGKKKGSNNVVNNAGFVVGARQVQSAGTVGHNAYATAGGPVGRTFFLANIMSESNGSSYFRDANIALPMSASIIRGMMMFPSGVLPGLSASFHEGAVANPSTGSTKAHGSYKPGLDAGASHGFMDLSANGGETFVMYLNGFSNTANYPGVLTCSMNPGRKNYFANVFNTDPTMIEDRGHYLYAHWDVEASQAVSTPAYGMAGHQERVLIASGAGGRNSFASGNDYVPNYEGFERRFEHAFTPFIISQVIGTTHNNLFKFHALDAGASGQNKFKISIASIQKSRDVNDLYGSFDVLIRDFNDTDMDPIILEKFIGVDLNPNSERYVARVIGDQNIYFDFDKNSANQKIVVKGDYANQSQFVRIEVTDDVKNGRVNAEALPIGFRGPHHLVTSGSTQLMRGLPSSTGSHAAVTTRLPTGAAAGLSNLAMQVPPLNYRKSVAMGTGNKKRADSALFWGVQYEKITDVDEPNKSTTRSSLPAAWGGFYPGYESSYPAWVGANEGAADANNAVLDADRFHNNIFTLERVFVKTKSGEDVVDPTQWPNASYVRNGVSPGTEGYRFLNVSKDFTQAASRRYYKFNVLMQGGFDGVNIFDRDKAKLLNAAAVREISDSTVQGGINGPTVAAYRKALEVIAEKTVSDIQLLAIPGIREPSVTDFAIDKVEERFDALYVMDIEECTHAGTADSAVVTGSIGEISVTNTAARLQARSLDTSFAAAYFPDCIITDSGTGANVRCPPSVAVLGAMSLNDAIAHPWFAPAGFTRGALATTQEVQIKMSRSNLDTLYEVDINPITQFPTSPGVVVFGQKTLLQAQSALDRVNVRRLLIDIRRKVRNIANGILFEPNRAATLERFSNAVQPVLSRIQAQQGLDRFKVVIDSSTTTQSDVENNTVRGKIFLQPTRSVEFISLDFVVTNAGAEI